MKIKCAVFDFDGTLFDSMFIWDRVGESYLRSLGKDPHPSMQDDLRTLSLYQSAVYLVREYSLAQSVDEVMIGINQAIERFYIEEVLPKPGVMDFLVEMKQAGIPMCIATASERYQIEAALARCKLDPFFDAIFTCSEVGHGKDEPTIYHKAMEYFHADCSSTVVFEDAIHAVQTAKGAGMIVAAVYDASEKRQEDLRQVSDYYLADYDHTEAFWNWVLTR